MASNVNTNANFNTKRKRIILCIEQKLEILKRLENGETGSSLALFYDIGKATISDIKHKRESILKFASKLKSENGSMKRKTMKNSRNTKLDKTVYTWLMEKRNRGGHVTWPELRERTLELNRELGGPAEFKAGPGWFKNFKIRHGIQDLYSEEFFSGEPLNTTGSGKNSNQLAADSSPITPSPQATPAVRPVPTAPRLISPPSTNIPLNPTDLYNLQWSEYSTKFSGSFSSLWEAQDLVDVTLGVDGRYIQAHKLVLSVCSDYFRDLFKINPCQHPIVILKDVDYDSFYAVVQFMYCGEVQITADKLPTLLRIAQQLKVKGLNNGEDKPEQAPPHEPAADKLRARESETPTTTCTTLKTQNKAPQKRTRYTIPSDVKVKILRRGPAETTNALLSGTWDPSSPGVATFQPTNHNYINLPSSSRHNFSPFVLSVVDAAPTPPEEKALDIMDTDFIEMIPVKVEDEMQDGDGDSHMQQAFELISGVKDEDSYIDEFQYATIEESDSEAEEDLRF